MTKDRQRLNAHESAEFANRLAQLLATKLPLAEGLRAAARETNSHKLADCLTKLADHLKRGGALDSDVLENGLRLPRHLSALIAMGFKSGNMPVVLGRLVEHYQTQADMWRRILWAVSYPLTLLLLLAILTVFLLFGLLPQLAMLQQQLADFESILQRESATAPKAIIWFAETGWMVFATLLIVIAVVMLALRVCFGKAKWDRFLSSFPLFGRLVHWSAVAELARLLHLMLSHNIPLPDALRNCAQGLSNADIAEVSQRLAGEIVSGKSLSEAITQNGRLPQFIAPFVRWGERTDRLPEALAGVLELIDGRLTLRTSLILRILPPILLLAIGGIVLAIATGVMYPMLLTLQAIS